MLLGINRKDSIVTITGISTPSDKNRYFCFSLDCKDNDLAEYLHIDLWNRFDESIRKARMDSYNEGWRDAKAHAKKKEYFNCRLEV